ncbi:esterase FrsA [Caballeronia udeis]|uniref:Esterase FrsA n=1 Tax=Caballeronia udeis TaxID=1232866 RepID=A0ABW8MTG1_9BURK
MRYPVDHAFSSKTRQILQNESNRKHRCVPGGGALIVVLTALVLSHSATAQKSQDQWQTRSWPELAAETQARADRGAYPLTGLKPDDVREALSHIHSLDRDEWASAWMAIGDRYEWRAKSEEATDSGAARDDYRAAWLNYSFGRWPSPNSPGKAQSYAKAQGAFANYGRLLNPPIETISISFEGKQIVAYLQKPPGVTRPPIVLDLGGMDEWKDSVANQGRGFLQDGIADVAVDMPGTGDAPMARPGAERVYSRLIDYLLTRTDVDGSRIVVRGTSWGSYWSARLAFVEANRLKGAVYQSGPVDGYFQRAWQDNSLHTKEYLFDFVASRLYVLGQPSVDALLNYMPSMSLKAAGLLGKPTSPMLLIGGVLDSQTPFADLLELLQTGTPKDAWVNPEGRHMGDSGSWTHKAIFDKVIRPWIHTRLTADQ